MQTRKRKVNYRPDLLAYPELEVRLKEHDRRVARIAETLAARRKGAAPLSIRKKTESHEIPKGKDLKYSDAKIDVRALNHILLIDPVNQICIAESGVAFVDLVRETLKHGLTPIVVPELKTITLGGAVAGCSVESTSYKFGGFHDTCLAMEVITARGTVLDCTPENENRLIFGMLHGTFGTLGIISKLTFRLMPAKPYVHVTYEKYPDLPSYTAAIERHYERQDVDFMDGIIHASDELVLSVGHFCDSAPYLNRYDRVKIYYKSTLQRKEDYLKTEHYFYRYDRGVTNVHPKSWLARVLFGWALGSSQILKLARIFRRFLNTENPFVILDVFVPFSQIESFFSWYDREIGFFPLWCVPYRYDRKYPWIAAKHQKKIKDKLFLDIAIYGLYQTADKNYHRIMEKKIGEYGGIKTLIDYNYFSEKEFWQLWNRENYNKVKKITDPDYVFRDLYEKTCLAPRGLTRPRQRNNARPP